MDAERSSQEDLIQDSYEAVIGLEIHVQLNTRSKIFSTDPVSFGGDPNTQAGLVTLAFPGTLPHLNKEVVAMGLRMALACHGEIPRRQHFDRKNYFYPDLPKGYQLTQDRSPLCRGGFIAVPVNNTTLRISLEKIHMEEDAGKSLHDVGVTDSLVDFNRAGVPLLEIVTKPVITSPADAAACVAEIRKMVRFIGISDGNMEEGSLRCDANVSIRPKGSKTLGKKVEIKNLNSLRNLSHALAHDIERQINLTEAGHPVASETRGFDVTSGKTFPQRTKEELQDYRYFPDPDLPPFEISEAWLNELQASMPALPEVWFERLINQYQLSASDARVVSDSREEAEYFEKLCSLGVRPKAAANWMMGPVKSVLNDKGWNMTQFPIAPGILAVAIQLVETNQVSFSTAAQRLLPSMMVDLEARPEILAAAMGILMNTDSDALEKVVGEVIREFPLKVEAYKEGKKGIVTMFMGEVMKRTGGKADPRKANELILKKLGS